MATFLEKLTAEGTDGESAEFLNSIIQHLWPNINVAAGKLIKDMVEPMFKTMLPSPLSSLQFTKIDLGPEPIRLSNAATDKTEVDGIRLNLNLDWASKSDIQLKANMIPALGVKTISLHGRLELLFCPLTDVLPCIGAVQMAFINPPVLDLDFTGTANVADFSLIHKTIRRIILGIVNSMFTLPNRFLYKLDNSIDYFQTYHYPLGVIRITVEKAWGFSEEARSSAKKLFAKITRAAPDCYAKVAVGAEPEYRTATLNNTHNPEWNDTKDFIVSDFNQCITIDVKDHDLNSDDDVGMAITTVRQLLLAGGKEELTLTLKREVTDGMLSISSQYFQFAPDAASLTCSEHQGEKQISGIAIVLISGAYDIQGKRNELTPSVVVTLGPKIRFQTVVVTDAPGTDINNPSFDQSFRIPLTGGVGTGQNFRLALLNAKAEIGGVDVPFADVTSAPGMKLEKTFDVGGGASIRAILCVRGLIPEKPSQEKLAYRTHK